MSGTPEITASTAGTPISRREALLLGGGLLLTGVGLNQVLDGDPARPAASGDTVVVNPPAEGAAEAPAASASQDPATIAANNEKTLADAAKTKAEAEQIRAQTETDRNRAGVDADEARAQTRREDVKAWGGVVTLFTGVVTTAAGGLRWLIDRRDTERRRIIEAETTERERIRTDAATEYDLLRERTADAEQRERERIAARDKDFEEVVAVVLNEDHENEDERQAASVRLTSFVSTSEYQITIFDTTTALLRQRSRPRVPRPLDPFQQNILTSFLRVATGIRDDQLRRNQAGSIDDYPDVDANIPSDLAAWEFQATQAPVIDASGINLDTANLVGQDFSRFDFAGGWGRNSRANNTIWSNADLSDFDLSGAQLRGARFNNTRCAGMRVTDADLRGAVLYHIDFNYLTIADAASLRGTRIIGTMGLDSEQIAALEARGAIVIPGEDYYSADALTSQGDDPVASSPEQ